MGVTIKLNKNIYLISSFKIKFPKGSVTETLDYMDSLQYICLFTLEYTYIYGDTKVVVFFNFKNFFIFFVYSMLNFQSKLTPLLGNFSVETTYHKNNINTNNIRQNCIKREKPRKIAKN